MPCGSVWFKINYIPELEILGFIMALIPQMALIWYQRLHTAAGGKDASHAAGMRLCASLGAGVGTSGSCQGDTAQSWSVGGQSRADFHLLIAMLPVSVWRARFGKGLGLLIVVGLFMDTYILQPARPGWGKGRLGAGQQAKGWLENLQLQEEVVHFQACGIFLWAHKQSTYPAVFGSTDVLLFPKPEEPLP